MNNQDQNKKLRARHSIEARAARASKQKRQDKPIVKKFKSLTTSLSQTLGPVDSGLASPADTNSNSRSKKIPWAALSESRFRRYWRFFVTYNILCSLRETMGAFVFFIVLQGIVGDASCVSSATASSDNIATIAGSVFGILPNNNAGSPEDNQGPTSTLRSLDGPEISELAIGTLMGWIAFIVIQLVWAKRTLAHHLVTKLPAAYFEPEWERVARSASDHISIGARIGSMDEIRKSRSRMANLALLAFLLWGGTVAWQYPHLGKPLPLVIAVGMAGAFLARLYYLRLRLFDVVPLLALEWGKESHPGLGVDKDQMYFQKTATNIEELRKSAKRTWLSDLEIGLTRWATWRIAWLLRYIRIIPAGALVRHQDGIDLKGYVNASIGARETYALGEAVVTVLIATFFFFGIVNGSKTIGLETKMNPSIVAVVMFVLLSLFYIPSMVRFVDSIYFRDKSDSYERSTAVAFGLIDQASAEDEYYSNEGRNDEKTGLMRYAGLFRRIIGDLIDMTNTISTQKTQRASGRPLMDFSILLFDIDNFKICNSVYGYIAADYLLRSVARVLIDVAEENHGYAGRFGGEEFCVVLPGIGADSAAFIADSAREKIAKGVLAKVNSDGLLRFTQPSGLRGGEEDPLTLNAKGYRTDADSEEVFPNRKKAQLELDRYEYGMARAKDNSSDSLQLMSLEHSKVEALRRLVDSHPGIVWPTTVSVGVVGGSDLRRLLKGRLDDGRQRIDYVSTFRRLFAIANHRVETAKARGRNRVVGVES